MLRENVFSLRGNCGWRGVPFRGRFTAVRTMGRGCGGLNEHMGPGSKVARLTKGTDELFLRSRTAVRLVADGGSACSSEFAWFGTIRGAQRTRTEVGASASSRGHS